MRMRELKCKFIVDDFLMDVLLVVGYLYVYVSVIRILGIQLPRFKESASR